MRWPSLLVFVWQHLAWDRAWPSATRWELMVFVGLPAAFGLSHLVTPRRDWGGKPYWLLAGVWFAAAVFGVLAHWPALDPLTPWFSLARDVLIACGLVLCGVSALLARACFAAYVDPRSQTIGSRLVFRHWTASRICRVCLRLQRCSLPPAPRAEVPGHPHPAPDVVRECLCPPRPRGLESQLPISACPRRGALPSLWPRRLALHPRRPALHRGQGCPPLRPALAHGRKGFSVPSFQG